MFENSSVMLLLNKDGEDVVQLLEVDKETQLEICNTFEEASTPMLTEKEDVEFDGSYKPNEDEMLFISNFNLPAIITDAIRPPLGLETFRKK